MTFENIDTPRASDALSAAQLGELRETFDLLDGDHSGGIDVVFL